MTKSYRHITISMNEPEYQDLIELQDSLKISKIAVLREGMRTLKLSKENSNDKKSA